MLDGHTIADLSSLEGLYGEWDELAVEDGLPQMSPAWVLAWWRHIAPADARPRVVAVRDRGKLVGLAPFYVQPRARVGRVDYRLPGIELAVRLAPLAVRGREWQVAETVDRLLAAADPRPDVIALEGHPVASQWPAAMRERWPCPVRPLARGHPPLPSPTVSLSAGSYEAWLAGKSAHFREHMRKQRRRFERAGGTFRMATEETLAGDVATLVALHESRWQSLGDSNLVAQGERMPAMLREVGERLLAAGRFRLMVLEIDGEAISAHLAIGAGGEVLAVNGGWDERWSRLSPTVVHCLYLIEDAFERGDRRIDLGLGGQSYKRRLADGDDPVSWVVLLTPRWRLPLTAVRAAPPLVRASARESAKRILTDRQVQAVRDLRRRGPIEAMRDRLRGRSQR